MSTMLRAGTTATTLTIRAALAAGVLATRAALAAGVLATAAALVAPAPAPAAAQPGPAPARAVTPTFNRLVAYVRDGDIYTSRGGTQRRLTQGGQHTRPRWSPDGRQIVFLRAGLPHVMNADGSGQRLLTRRPAAGPAWSPDGRWIAFASAGCVGGPAVYRISTGTPNAQPEAIFPVECRGEQLPAITAAVPAPTGTLADRLRQDDALAWSPDGTRIAFRGGQCESVYDTCLSLGTIATGGERVLAAYGGGGQEHSGFAVVPSFRPDGTKVAWTAYQEGSDAKTTLPVHVTEYDLSSGTVRRLGAEEDRELVYEGTGRALVTGRHQNSSWIIAVDLGSGARAPLHPGSQPAYQP